jgi:cytochrome c553
LTGETMRRSRAVLLHALLLMAPFDTLPSGNIAAGKAKVAQVCAACHGPEGQSVAETIPNLGGQRERYIEEQLLALKSGVRKNGIMNPIAGQLSRDDIANIAAYFSSLPGAGSNAVSDFMPNIARTNATFPANHRATFVKYNAANFPDLKQVRHYYANPIALAAARAGARLPDGAVILTEVSSVKLDDRLELAKGPDGIYIPNQLVFYSVMARGAGWGKDIPEILRNEDWNYAAFTPQGQLRPRINHAECLACHKSQDEANYTFTMKELSAFAKR